MAPALTGTESRRKKGVFHVESMHAFEGISAEWLGAPGCLKTSQRPVTHDTDVDVQHAPADLTNLAQGAASFIVTHV